jgi:hypothetical protein
MSEQRFPLGQLATTPGALESLLAMGKEPVEFIARHAQGDWGDLGAHDQAANQTAITDGFRIFSAYQVDESTRIYVITEADRSVTTVLLADEY